MINNELYIKRKISLSLRNSQEEVKSKSTINKTQESQWEFKMKVNGIFKYGNNEYTFVFRESSKYNKNLNCSKIFSETVRNQKRKKERELKFIEMFINTVIAI